jgi:hypothetical protein
MSMRLGAGTIDAARKSVAGVERRLIDRIAE